MKIFDKRPLCLILCVWLGGFVFSTTSVAAVVIFAAALLLLSVIIRFKGRGLLFFVSVVLMISAISSHMYFDRWFRAYERFDGEVEIYGYVTGHSQGKYNDRFYIRTSSIGDEPFSKYNLILDIPRDERGALRPGCEIHIKSELASFDGSDNFDAESYYFSKGISGEISSYDSLEILSFDTPTLSYTFNEMRESLQRRAILFSDYDSGTLLTALLLGERDALSSQVSLDFTRLGITHILALSGMHLTILAAAINALFSLFKIGKKARLIITVILSVLYMAFTGFSVSVARAGLMLILTTLLYLLTRGSDSVTSLSVAVTFICIVTPYAIYDLALWLSAFATLGVIIFAEYSQHIPKTTRIPLRVLRYFAVSILASVFAIIMTLPITLGKFYGTSAISPIATLIFSVLTELIMYFGTVVLLLGGIFPFLGKGLILLTDATLWLAARMSEWRLIYASTSHAAIWVTVVVLFIAFILFLVLDLKKKLKHIAVLTVCIIFSVTVGEIMFFANADRNEELALYFAEEHSDCFLLKSEGECALINSSTYSENIAYSIKNTLEEHNVTYIDKYAFTHYAYALTDDISTLMSYFLVGEIYLPKPRNDSEEQILELVREEAEAFRTEIVLYEPYDFISVGDMRFKLLFSMPYGEGSSVNSLFLELDGKCCTYISSGLLELDEELLRSTENYMSVSDIHIFGKHGKKYKKDIYFNSREYSLEALVMNNVFLTPEAYSEYEESGCKIYSHPHLYNMK